MVSPSTTQLIRHPWLQIGMEREIAWDVASTFCSSSFFDGRARKPIPASATVPIPITKSRLSRGHGRMGITLLMVPISIEAMNQRLKERASSAARPVTLESDPPGLNHLRPHPQSLTRNESQISMGYGVQKFALSLAICELPPRTRDFLGLSCTNPLP